MSLLGSALGNLVAGAGGAAEGVANQYIKSDNELANSTALQQQAAQIQKARDEFVNQLAMQRDDAQSQAAVSQHAAIADVDNDPTRVAATAARTAAVTAAETKAKTDNTPETLSPGQIRFLNGTALAENKNLTGPQATLAAERMRIAADQAAAAAAASGPAAQSVSYQTIKDANGNETLIAVPTKIVAGVAPTGTAVTNADGSPLLKAPSSAKPLTNDQANAAVYGARAQEADKILRGLDGQYSPAAVALENKTSDIPVLGAAVNAVTGSSSQLAAQAQRDFVTAILRKESGAAISQSEFNTARAQYFPQPGDGEDVIAQKAANRQTLIAGMQLAAGQKPPFTAPSASAVTGVPSGWTVTRH